MRFRLSTSSFLFGNAANLLSLASRRLLVYDVLSVIILVVGLDYR